MKSVFVVLLHTFLIHRTLDTLHLSRSIKPILATLLFEQRRRSKCKYTNSACKVSEFQKEHFSILLSSPETQKVAVFIFVLSNLFCLRFFECFQSQGYWSNFFVSIFLSWSVPLTHFVSCSRFTSAFAIFQQLFTGSVHKMNDLK